VPYFLWIFYCINNFGFNFMIKKLLCVMMKTVVFSHASMASQADLHIQENHPATTQQNLTCLTVSHISVVPESCLEKWPLGNKPARVALYKLFDRRIILTGGSTTAYDNGNIL